MTLHQHRPLHARTELFNVGGDHVMSKLTIALCAWALAFGPASAQAADTDKNPPEEKAAAQSPPAAKKDWPTRREKQEAAAAAARERAERVQPKEQPLVGDFGPPSANAPDRSRVKPKPTTAEKEREKEKEKDKKEKKSTPSETTSAPARDPAPAGKP
jgi:hypothetical protein